MLPGNDVHHTLNIHKLPVGTYIVRINFNRGVSVTRKVVKGE